jgi:hypothetical protein
MNPIQTLMLRARRYWFVDGFWEIGIGLVLLVDGVTFLATSAKWTPLGLLVVPYSGILGVYLIRRLKESITYPRTGYAGSQPLAGPGVQKFAPIALALMGLFSCAALPLILFAYIKVVGSTFQKPFDATMSLLVALLPLLLGLLLASGLFYWGHKYRIMRFYGLAAGSTLVSGGLFMLSLVNGFPSWQDIFSLTRELGVYCTLMGLALLGSGLLTFRTYLRQNPAPLEEAR